MYNYFTTWAQPKYGLYHVYFRNGKGLHVSGTPESIKVQYGRRILKLERA